MNSNYSTITLISCLILLLVACSQTVAPPLPDDMLPTTTTPLPVVEAQTEPATDPQIQEPKKNNTKTPQPTRQFSSSAPTILSDEIVTMPVKGNLENLIDIAKQDLAWRLKITPDEIEVVHIEKAEWPDTSLGCAEPGLVRRPVAIPGYRIILSAKGRKYVYHTGKESGVVYCPKG